MRIEIQHAPSSTVACCYMNQGERLTAEGGAMMAMRGDVGFTTTTHAKGGGGFLKGLKRMLSGENFFINHFDARSEAEVWLATPLPGDIFVHELKGEKIIIQGGSYVASGNQIAIDLEWQGLKSIFSGESIFWVKAKGIGPVIVNSFGQIFSMDVDGEYVVDTGHIVAFQETLSFEITKVGNSWLNAFLGGEGFVCKFRGRGKVWVQSHSARSFGYSLRPYLRPKKG